MVDRLPFPLLPGPGRVLPWNVWGATSLLSGKGWRQVTTSVSILSTALLIIY
jgi:hypothetical protein